MADSPSNAIPEVAKATSNAHPPVQDINMAAEMESDHAEVMGDRMVRAIGGGSPETPPSQLAGALGQMGGSSRAAMLRGLQRNYGNSYVGAVIQRKCECGEGCGECVDEQDSMLAEKQLQRKGEGSFSVTPNRLEANIQKSGTGAPLSASTRSSMESLFRQDFSEVRIHADSSAASAARQLHAQAFTMRRDIYFGAGRFQPDTQEGKKLLAHELTHVVQQNSGAVTSSMTKSALAPSSDKLELEADIVANEVVAGRPISANTISSSVQPQIQRFEFPSIGEIAEGILSVGEGIVGGGLSVAVDMADLPNQFRALQRQISRLQLKVNLIGGIHLSDALWERLRGAAEQLNELISQLPFDIPGLTTGLSALLSGQGVITTHSVLVLPVAIGAILEALGAAIVLALWYIGLAILAILILYLLYIAIKTIVEAIAEAIEAMRNQPPIFWSASLPLPGPIGMPVIRTKPPNPRVPGGQQDTVRATIPPPLRTVLIAHHVLPLFLGGRDELTAPPNVVPWPRAMHLIGHPSLQIQPQMAVWGYPISLYDHPPPAGYFIAGIKAP